MEAEAAFVMVVTPVIEKLVSTLPYLHGGAPTQETSATSAD